MRYYKVATDISVQEDTRHESEIDEQIPQSHSAPSPGGGENHAGRTRVGQRGRTITGVRKSRPFDRETLEKIVATDEKQRYSFNENHTLIRANQGHSVPVDVELLVTEPPEILYHGTGEKYAPSIDAQGLLPRRRLYVHLSGDEDTAWSVGIRHGRPVIYKVLSGRMSRDGFVFYRSVNGVWLTKTVPAMYLRRL